MKKIEQEFAELKDSLFSNSIKWLEKDFQRIRSGMECVRLVRVYVADLMDTCRIT